MRIVKQGDQIGQGVGYLEDGTMVVVEQGRTAIGQEVHITVTSVLQTPAGRMIFGRIDQARPATRRWPVGAWQGVRGACGSGPAGRSRSPVRRPVSCSDAARPSPCSSPPSLPWSAAARTAAAPSSQSKQKSKSLGDLEMVERLLIARRDLQSTLEQLRTYYINNGDVERATWAEDELRHYHRILKHPFRLELDRPAADAARQHQHPRRQPPVHPGDGLQG